MSRVKEFDFLNLLFYRLLARTADHTGSVLLQTDDDMAYSFDIVLKGETEPVGTVFGPELEWDEELQRSIDKIYIVLDGGGEIKVYYVNGGLIMSYGNNPSIPVVKKLTALIRHEANVLLHLGGWK